MELTVSSKRDLDKKLRKFQKRLETAEPRIRENITDVMTDNMIDITNTIKESMQTTKRASYSYSKGSGGKRRHFPSKPGHPPAVDDGNLIKAITFDVRQNLEFAVGVLDIADYAPHLEFGTEHMRERERPFIEPALNKQSGKIIRDVAKALGDSI